MRKLMSSSDKENVPFEEFVDAGLFKFFSEMITENFDETIQVEALHTLSNVMIMPFVQIQAIIESSKTNTIDSMIKLAKSEKLNIFDCAIWALTNLFADEEAHSVKEC